MTRLIGGIHVDEGVSAGGAKGPYKQSERKAIYRQYANQLIESKQHCAFDTLEELTEMRERMIGGNGFSSMARHSKQYEKRLTLPAEGRAT